MCLKEKPKPRSETFEWSDSFSTNEEFGDKLIGKWKTKRIKNKSNINYRENKWQYKKWKYTI